ncbi:type VI secretion system-associated protein TagO [Martelella endophytica]|uniref:Type VI secretion protein n=1 Tax=Martelella endophytica TaxID=1486262 RepID=A0A0D5LS50_MAREN|nr:type VI secretion system-associated protein TagO [Martelella endophytica]AJY46896.1 hypothetical protein TM49_16370 [Martelella endophytica]
MNFYVKPLALFTVAFASITNGAFAANQDPAECHNQDTDRARLICYDHVTGYEASAEPGAPISGDELDKNLAKTADKVKKLGLQWRVRETKSKLDERHDVFLTTLSSNTQPNQIGQYEHASLTVRCMENTTSVLFGLPQYISDSQTVRYRLDDDPVRSIWMDPMRGGDGAGVWTGAKAIPFIKQMLGKNELILSFKAYSRGLEFTFPIYGLKGHINQVAEACKWKL